ncbi:anti-phage dCTP deaminase [Vibrio anguillarum]
MNLLREQKSKSDDLEPLKRHAFIVSSLKHPEEVQKLRTIYSKGFFLIGIHSNEKRRKEFLENNKSMSNSEATLLIQRDADESDKHGQHTRDTYHLSDFFIDFGANRDKAQHDIWRTLDLMFGKPYVTPTFDEFAMFMAFSSSLRSADLSRQVGAVMTKNKNIIATGANDIPQFGGGLYWPEYDSSGVKIIDKDNGRDWKRGFDSNAREKKLIINNIIDSLPDEKAKDTLRELLHSSKIKDITEYGRVVHAEMEAILACARSDISTKDAELYCTTFPCHNCAKHIVASGIKRVVYVEPYPKSKALDFHSDSITLELDGEEGVKFEPFVGVGPRSFYDLFSTNLGAGYPIKRKDPSGNTVSWNENSAILRMQMLSTSYIERETAAASAISDYRSKYNDSK